MLNEIELKTKREALVKERDGFVMQANGQIAYLNGQIDMIDALLGTKPETIAPVSSNGQHPAYAGDAPLNNREEVKHE